MRSLILIGLLFSHFSLAAPSEILSPWRDYSDPIIMGPHFERSFEKLPLHGLTSDSQKLWANDYWPRRRGGINYRWNSSDPKGFDLVSPGRNQVLKMSQNELATLAPSEKLDLLNGNYDYPFKKEVDKGASQSAPIWHGICNGWSPAAINHNEPLPKNLINPDGVLIPFGSSDIKALISYYYAYKHRVESTNQMGRRCNFNFGTHCDDDLNAGAFHVVLANKVGIEQSSFVADVERKRQVWNHAVNEYTTTIVNANLAPDERESAPGTVRRVHVKTVMSFVLKIRNNRWDPTLGTDDHVNEVRNYEYYLELNSAGEIIGGEWISKARPDFLWTMAKATEFGGYFTRMHELLND